MIYLWFNLRTGDFQKRRTFLWIVSGDIPAFFRAGGVAASQHENGSISKSND